jgi:hypothetical protein
MSYYRCPLCKQRSNSKKCSICKTTKLGEVNMKKLILIAIISALSLNAYAYDEKYDLNSDYNKKESRNHNRDQGFGITEVEQKY